MVFTTSQRCIGRIRYLMMLRYHYIKILNKINTIKTNLIMRKILQKMAWKTHRWGWEVSLFNIYLNGQHNEFGFQILNVKNGIVWEGSLFEITWAFPTVTHAGELVVDLFFLFEKWDDWCIDMTERVLWGSKLTRWEKFNQYLHGKFKSIR